MAIKIPSKNIYNIDFNPVIDNNVDMVEVAAKNVVPDNRYNEPVYNYSENKDINSDDGFGSIVKDYKLAQVVATYKWNASALGYRTRYAELNISFPKKSQHLITRVYDKLNNDNRPNIGVSLYTKKYTGTAIGQLGLHVGSNTHTVLYYGFSGVSNKNNGVNVEITDDAPYGIPHSYLYEPIINGIQQSAMNLSFSFTDETNINTANIVFNSTTDSYNVSLKILTDLRIYAVAGSEEIRETNTDYEIPLNGTITDYLTSKIEVTIYGDTLAIDLQEKTIQIGDGDNIFSFDGNELIQDTNTPTPESKYQGIVDKWNNGKQTAVISCPITDYYDENARTEETTDNKIISENIYTVAQQTYYTNTVTVPVNDGSISSVNVAPPLNKLLKSVKIINTTYNTFTYQAELISTPASGISIPIMFNVGVRYLPETPTIAPNSIYTDKRMVFDIGDIVIPYTYTNKGDRPLSYNKDFTPKQFQIVGTKISTTQGVTQELTLLEV